LEQGGDVEAFRADLEAARAAAGRLGVKLASIVFPRNQVDRAYLSVCREVGLRAFRGNERVWFLRARRESEQTPLARACRLADSYLPIGGSYDHEPALVDGMVDIPASRFLRPVGLPCWSTCAFGGLPRPWRPRPDAENSFISGGTRTISVSTYKKIWRFCAAFSIVSAHCKSGTACGR
jgi:hypothetical protein